MTCVAEAEIRAQFALSSQDVHVWCANLKVSASELLRLSELLSSDEKEKADCFRFRDDRDRYIAGRGTLRSILGNYLDTLPQDIRFSYSGTGKPSLANSSAHIMFNASHSASLFLIALSIDRKVGVDVEQIRHDFPFEEIAPRVFSCNELSKLHPLAAESRITAFFDLWTRKEALLKASGHGFSAPVDEIDVLSYRWGGLIPFAGLEWFVRPLVPIPGFRAAIAVEGPECRLQWWNCSLDLVITAGLASQPICQQHT